MADPTPIGSTPEPRPRTGPDWPEKCRPSPPTAGRARDGIPVDTAAPRWPGRTTPGSPVDAGEAISLYEAGKRLGLMGRSRRNWTDLLNPLAFKSGIPVRYEVDGIPCIRAADLPRLGAAVDRHFARPRVWPAKKSGRRGPVTG